MRIETDPKKSTCTHIGRCECGTVLELTMTDPYTMADLQRAWSDRHKCSRSVEYKYVGERKSGD